MNPNENLPPGVSDSMLPGNGPLDAVAERYPETWSEDDVREAEAAKQADHDNERARENE